MPAIYIKEISPHDNHKENKFYILIILLVGTVSQIPQEINFILDGTQYNPAK